MDKKANNKAVNFFKKEGFYVILFVCLCIVATVASITAKNNKKLSSNPPVGQNEQANAGDNGPIIAEDPTEQYDGALQVKKQEAAKTMKLVPNIQAVKKADLTVAPVSKPVNAQFEKPVANGKLARAYSKELDTVIWKTDNSYRTNLGIDIQAKIGETVVSVMDGIVKEVGTDVEGQKGKMVVIDHQNGFVTKYSNLDEKILVKKGDKVTKKQQIGTVGNTTLNSFNEEYGPHLHFEVSENNKHIDPAKYVKYEPIPKK